jgi:hypothetical protein
MINGGIGIIEEGKLKGRKFIIPAHVWVEKGTFLNGAPEFSLACLKHQKFIPTGGCPECKAEAEEKQQKNKDIGLTS